MTARSIAEGRSGVGGPVYGESASSGRPPAPSSDSWRFSLPTDSLKEVLVIEPDDGTRSLISLALSREGFRPLGFTSGEDGLRELSGDRALPAAVVSEVQLPGADGFALCGRLRADQRTAQVPFILLSDSVGPRQVELATGVGADDFVIKPAFLRDLGTLVRLKAGVNPYDSSFRANSTSLPLPELLRALLSGVRSGKVEVENGGGQLTFRQGRLVDAFLRGRKGPNAVLPILLLADSNYSVRFTPLRDEGSFSMDLEELCKNVLPSIWQWRQQASTLRLSSRLVVDFARFRLLQAEIPDAICDVMRLFDGHRSVRDCILDGAFDEMTTLAVVNRLHHLKVLIPWVPGAKSKQVQSKTAGTKPLRSNGDGHAASSVEAKTEHYEELGQLLLSEEPLAIEVDSRTGRALHSVAAVIGALVVAVGAGWVVARSNPGRALFGLGGRPAQAAKRTTAPPSEPPARASESPGQAAPAEASDVHFAKETLPSREPLLELHQTSDGKRKIAPSLSAQSTSEFWLITGLARLQAGDEEGARAAALKALELDAKNGGAAVLLGTLHLNADERKQAEKALGRYLELEPQGAYADQARSLLASP